jgi:hypothetical protein
MGNAVFEDVPACPEMSARRLSPARQPPKAKTRVNNPAIDGHARDSPVFTTAAD